MVDLQKFRNILLHTTYRLVNKNTLLPDSRIEIKLQRVHFILPVLPEMNFHNYSAHKGSDKHLAM